jgi:hypothetical protein
MLVASAAYASVLALVPWQALRGQPLVRPDAATLVVAGLISAGTAVGVLAAMGRGERRAARLG